jgi:hypothetical protein
LSLFCYIKKISDQGWIYNKTNFDFQFWLTLASS